MEPVPAKRVQRLYEKVASNQKNCSFDDLARLLVAVGFTQRAAKGSHVFFKRGAQVLSVPKARPVKENYVKQALALIGSVEGPSDETPGGNEQSR